MNYVVLDFETTGLNYQREQVIEIAAIKLDEDLKEIGAFNTFVNLYVRDFIPEFIVGLTGITDNDVKNGMSRAAAFKALGDFIGHSTVVAQYAPFDLAFLAEAGIRPYKFICTKSLTSQAEPEESSSLGPTCARLGIKLENAHRAIDDARATAELLKYRLSQGGLEVFNTIVTTVGRPLNYIPPATDLIMAKGSGDIIADFREVEVE
jgi:DNA polymerase III subunit epsilon